MKIKEVIKKRRGLYAIVFEGNLDLSFCEHEEDSQGNLLLDEYLVDNAKIKQGKEFSEEEIVYMVDESHRRRAKQRALWYLSRGDMSEKELADKLLKSFPTRAVIYAIDRMKIYGYIDDEKYAARLAERLVKDKLTSKRNAAYQMTVKGLSRELVESSLEEIDNNPIETITEIINKKYLKKLQGEDGVKKVVAALLRLGFNYSDIKTAIKSIHEEAEFNIFD